MAIVQTITFEKEGLTKDSLNSVVGTAAHYREVGDMLKKYKANIVLTAKESAGKVEIKRVWNKESAYNEYKTLYAGLNKAHRDDIRAKGIKVTVTEAVMP